MTSPSWQQKCLTRKLNFVSICRVQCSKHDSWRKFSGYFKEMYTFTLENRILTLLVALATCSEFLFKHCIFLPKTAQFLKISSYWKRNFSSIALNLSPACLQKTLDVHFCVSNLFREKQGILHMEK